MKKLFLLLLPLSILVFLLLNRPNQYKPLSYSSNNFEAFTKKEGNLLKTEFKANNSGIAFAVPHALAENSTTSIKYETRNTGEMKGLKETIILKDKGAPSEYVFDLNLENVQSFKYDPAKRSWHFFNSSNREVFYIPAGFMVDANKQRSEDVNIDIESNGSNYLLKVTADKKWLEDPTRAYPVEIDPSVVIPQADTNYITVTKIDRFRWKLAIEYEVRDSEGKLLGSDVVIIAANEEETSEDLFKFLESYFNYRNAVWILSDGNHTLREMSFDRLTSPHFKSDSAIEEENLASQERSEQIINSVTETNYPVYSLTSSEASNLRKDMTIQDEKIGAGTEILRPNSNGTYQYLYIDEAVADDASSYITGNGWGYVELQNTVLTIAIVDSIDVTTRGYGDGNAGQCFGGTGSFAGGVRRAATYSYGTGRTHLTWTTGTDTAIARPGGGSWVLGDLNALQMALYLIGDSGNDYCEAIDDWEIWSSNSYITQGYITVNFSFSKNVRIQRGVQINRGTLIKP